MGEWGGGEGSACDFFRFNQLYSLMWQIFSERRKLREERAARPGRSPRTPARAPAGRVPLAASRGLGGEGLGLALGSKDGPRDQFPLLARKGLAGGVPVREGTAGRLSAEVAKATCGKTL